MLTKRCEVGRRLRVEDVFASLVELVQRTGLAQLQSKLRRRFRGRFGVRQEANQLVGGNRAII